MHSKKNTNPLARKMKEKQRKKEKRKGEPENLTLLNPTSAHPTQEKQATNHDMAHRKRTN
jgi:hypothetical protein